MPPWLFLALSLAAYRLTRLINEDSILDAPRSWVYRHAPRLVAELIACPFCIGFWLAGGLVLAVDLYGISVPLPIVVWLSVAGGAGLVYEFRRVE